MKTIRRLQDHERVNLEREALEFIGRRKLKPFGLQNPLDIISANVAYRGESKGQLLSDAWLNVLRGILSEPEADGISEGWIISLAKPEPQNDQPEA